MKITLHFFSLFFLNFRGAIRRITLELSTRVVYAKYKVNNIYLTGLLKDS